MGRRCRGSPVCCRWSKIRYVDAQKSAMAAANYIVHEARSIRGQEKLDEH